MKPNPTGPTLKAQYPPGQALRVALELMALLTDVVERIEIAGSLRRCKPTVGDVELVMSPRTVEQLDLFGNVRARVNLLDRRFEEMRRLGIVSPRLNSAGNNIAWPSSAARYRAMLYRGIPVDAFIVLPDRQWGPTMLIRTGPGDANGVLVTRDGTANREGLLGVMPAPLEMRDGALWSPWERISTPEECDVFAALELPYIAPQQRSVEAYQLAAGRRVVHEMMQKSGWRFAGTPDLWHELRWRVQPAWESVRNAA